MANIMQIFQIEVWFRFVSFGEQEKDFEHHTIEALSLQEAVNKASELYKSFSQIPFAYYEVGNNDVKLKPTTFTVGTIYELTNPN